MCLRFLLHYSESPLTEVPLIVDTFGPFGCAFLQKLNSYRTSEVKYFQLDKASKLHDARHLPVVDLGHHRLKPSETFDSVYILYDNSKSLDPH